MAAAVTVPEEGRAGDKGSSVNKPTLTDPRRKSDDGDEDGGKDEADALANGWLLLLLLLLLLLCDWEWGCALEWEEEKKESRLAFTGFGDSRRRREGSFPGDTGVWIDGDVIIVVDEEGGLLLWLLLWLLLLDETVCGKGGLCAGGTGWAECGEEGPEPPERGGDTSRPGAGIGRTEEGVEEGDDSKEGTAEEADEKEDVGAGAASDDNSGASTGDMDCEYISIA